MDVMSTTSFTEKDGSSIIPSSSPQPSSSSSTYFSSLTPLHNVYNKFSQWRASLGLSNPGTVENLQKEVKSAFSSSPWPPCSLTHLALDTHLTNFFFDGARADITKGLSMNPAFQTTHSFTLGSQTASPSYNFGSVFATQNVGHIRNHILHSRFLPNLRFLCKAALITTATSMRGLTRDGQLTTLPRFKPRHVSSFVDKS